MGSAVTKPIVQFDETKPGNKHFMPDQKNESVKKIASKMTWYSPKFSPKDVPRFYDISGLTEDPEAFKLAMDIFIERYKNDVHGTGGPTHIVGYGARGFLFAPIAVGLGIPFVLLRKNGKMPGVVVESNPFHKEYAEDHKETFCLRIDAVKPGSRVVLFDDLIATGGTAIAGFDLINGIGAEVYEFGSLVELPFLNGVQKIHEHDNGRFKNVPVCTLIDDNIIGDDQGMDPKSWPVDDIGRSVGFQKANELAKEHGLL